MYQFEFGDNKLPNYDVPEEFETHLDYFKNLCYKGILKDMEKILHKKY